MNTKLKATFVTTLASTGLLFASEDDHQPVAPPTAVPATIFWGDFDGDRLDDAWIVQPDGAGQLLHNDGRGTFANVTERVGLDSAKGAHMALFRDVDGDGRTDLYLPAWRGVSRLMRQTKSGAFEDVTRLAGLPEHAEPVHASWKDFDGDGRADLHLVTLHDDLLYRNLGEMRFEKVDLGLEPRVAPELDTLAAAQQALGNPGSNDAQAGQNGWVHFGSGPGTTGTQIVCARTLQDQAFPTDCLMASSVPTMGMLFPISSDLFIDDVTGNVGIGTTSPGFPLEVIGTIRTSGDVRGNRGVFAADPPFGVSGSLVVTNLNADLLDGFDSSDFSMLGNSIGSGELEDNSVTNAKMADNAIGSAEVINDSLTATDLAAGSVGNSELGTDSVSLAKMADSSVGSLEVINDSLTAVDLAPNSVGFSELATNSVTFFKIADNSVGGGKVIDSSLSGADIADETLTSADLGPDSVGASEIADGSIFDIEVNVAAAIAGTKIVPAFGNQDVTAIGNADFEASSGATVRADSINGPTTGYVGAQGATDFDGVLSADWFGLELGVAGISTGGSPTDNYGVMGHSNYAGVRGEHADNPAADWGHLGMADFGVVANGDTAGVSATNSFDAESLGQLGRNGYGVWGQGGNAGVQGGDAGIGAFDGVRGVTDNSAGYAVWGINFSTTGISARGVFGTTASASSFGVYASGGMGGTGAKYFINPHPTNPLKEVRMVCLEGDESGTYFRGTSSFQNGVAIIEVPEVFRLASIEERLTVQMTAVGAPATMWIESKALDQIVVRSNADVEFDYFVNGVRRGYENIDLIVDNQSYVPSPDEMGKPFGTQYPDSYRQMLVENGILNPDFTPNEATIAMMEAALEFYAVRNADVLAVRAAEARAQADAQLAAERAAASPRD